MHRGIGIAQKSKRLNRNKKGLVLWWNNIRRQRINPEKFIGVLAFRRGLRLGNNRYELQTVKSRQDQLKIERAGFVARDDIGQIAGTSNPAGASP